MRNPIQTRLPGGAMMSLLLLCAALSPASAQTYRIRELPPPNASGLSFAPGINDAGIAVGRALMLDGNYHAVRWIDGIPTDLGVLAGTSESIAYGISNSNLVVGCCGDSCDPTESTLWSPSGPQGLAVEVTTVAKAYEVNESGVAVGEGWNSCTVPWQNAAYEWRYSPDDGSWNATHLSPLSGDAEAGAHDINESSVAVGFSGDSSVRLRACRWDSGVVGSLPDLGGGHSIAKAINDAGQFAGYSRTESGTFRAYFFDGASVVNLGTLPGFAHSAARRLSNAGTIVGHAFNGTGSVTFWPYDGPDPNQRAFIWRDGVMHSAMTLIPAGSGWASLNSLADINQRGQITGYGMRSGRYRAFVLTPECMLRGDLDDDRTIDLVDLSLLLSDFGCSGFVCPGDVTGDGTVDLTDLAIQLANFGTSCD